MHNARILLSLLSLSAITDASTKVAKNTEDTTNLNVRSVPTGIAKALRERAAKNNRSAEAEHREILKQALGGTQRLPLAEALKKIPPVGLDSDFERQDDNGRA